jgi:DnaJ homolog subfamily C member 28
VASCAVGVLAAQIPPDGLIVSFEQLIESQIQEAIEAGAFENLPGAGKPLQFTDQERLAGDNWLGYKVLQNGGMLPEWLGLAREIERDQEALDRVDAHHAEIVSLAAGSGDWETAAPALRFALARYEEQARNLRRKQERYNYNAPGFRCQRPAIWVEFHLDRLRTRALEAGAPAALL